MINEKVARWLDNQIKKGAMEGDGSEDEIIMMEISARKSTIRNLDRQKRKEEDEMEYLESQLTKEK